MYIYMCVCPCFTIKAVINLHPFIKGFTGFISIRVLVFSLYVFDWEFEILKSQRHHRCENTSSLLWFFYTHIKIWFNVETQMKFYYVAYIPNPGNKLMQNKGSINVKRRLNSAAKSWTQINFNITFEINGKIIAVNIHWNYLFFTV